MSFRRVSGEDPAYQRRVSAGGLAVRAATPVLAGALFLAAGTPATSPANAAPSRPRVTPELVTPELDKATHAQAKPAAERAALKVSISGVPQSIALGRAIALQVQVSNVGRRATQNRVTVTATAGKGLSVAPDHGRYTIVALAAGRSRRLQMRVTLKASSVKLTVRAQAVHARASKSVVLREGQPGGQAVNPPPAPDPSPLANPLVGTFWWNFQPEYADGVTQNNTGFYFVTATTVYSGLPTNGLPASCAPQAVDSSLPIDQQGACLSYSYNSATGALTIGSTTGSYAGGALTVGNTRYQQLTIEPAGFTTDGQFQVIQTFGLCTVACTIDTSNFGLASSGQFYLASGTIGSLSGGGSSTWASVFPPSETGTYTVNANGSITLHFADGTVETYTFAAQGSTPSASGIVLDQLSYLPPSTG